MRKVIFHHIAKTAGTSLIAQLKTAFQGRVCSARYDGELTDEMMKDASFAFYHGHFSFEKLEKFKSLNPDAFAFVFLRHPVNRVISQYYNWIDKERTRTEYNEIAKRRLIPPEQVAGKLAKFEQTIFKMSLAEFLDHKDSDVIDVVNNHQTRYMSRRQVYETNNLLGCVDAIQNLTTFYDFVGLAETYQASVERLTNLLGVGSSTTVKEVRTNTNDEQKVGGLYEEDRSAVLKIIEKNSYDLCLFHYALGQSADLPQEDFNANLLLKLPKMT